jgi:hypothetical protein
MESHSASFLDSTLPQDAQDEWETPGDALELQSPRPPPVIPSPTDATKTTTGTSQQQLLLSTPLAAKAQGGASASTGFLSSVWSALRRASFSTPTTSTGGGGGEGEGGGVLPHPTNALHLLQTPTQPPPLPPKTPASTLARLSAYESKVLQVGWLYKEGHVRKNWKRRWFVLRGWSLQYFRRGPRSEGAAEAAVREAMDAASGLGGGRSALELLSAMLPPNKEPPAGVIDIRGFTLESGAFSTLTPKLAMRLSNRVEGGGDFVLVAESEQTFVAWVKVLAVTIMEWEKIQRD